MTYCKTTSMEKKSTRITLTHWVRDKIADKIDNFKCIFLKENESMYISLKISWTFVPKVQMNSILALVQIISWHRPGDKPLSGLIMFNFSDSFMRHSASMI